MYESLVHSRPRRLLVTASTSVFFVRKCQLFNGASGNRYKDLSWESTFSEAPKNVPPCTLASLLDTYLFIYFPKWSHFSITKTYILFCSCSENAMALSHSFCFPCLGAAFREQIICGKALFIWELFSENYLTTHCCSRDHLSPLEDKACHCLLSYDFLWEGRWLLAW